MICDGKLAITNSHCVRLLRAEKVILQVILGAKNVIGTVWTLTFILKLGTGSRGVAIVICAIMLGRSCEGKRAGCRASSQGAMFQIFTFSAFLDQY